MYVSFVIRQSVGGGIAGIACAGGRGHDNLCDTAFLRTCMATAPYWAMNNNGLQRLACVIDQQQAWQLLSHELMQQQQCKHRR